MTKFFIILLLLNVLIFANANSGFNIDAQISKIRSAPASERVKLMNAFKQRVFQMNRDERSVAIRKIQIKMHAEKSQKDIREVSVTKIQEVREHALELQVQSSDDISNYQNMNQQQIKNLIAHEKIEKKDGRISKIKILNQILKIEREEQEIKIPINKIIKQLPSKNKIKIIKQIKESYLNYTKEQPSIQSPSKQIIIEQIKEIPEVQVPNIQRIDQIQDIQTLSSQVYISEPKDTQVPSLNYIKEN